MSSTLVVPVRWRVTGSRVRGAAHDAEDLPNQDSISWVERDGARAILAVSDGHGDRKCFRSDIGSDTAVHTAIDILDGFDPARQDELPRRLVEEWHKRVGEHLAAHPFTADERARLERAQGAAAFGAVTQNPTLAYGATLVAVLVTPAYVLYVQLGDGDILTTDEAGATRRVFVKNPALAINETESLCQPDAERFVKVRRVPLAEELPALILASTDGYVNSFATDADFLQIGRDLRAMIRENGIELVARQLPDMLAETSRSGSRDDITIGIIKRIERDETESGAATDAREHSSPSRRGRSGMTTLRAAAMFVVAAAVATVIGARAFVPHGESPAQAVAAGDAALARQGTAGAAAALAAYDRALGHIPLDGGVWRRKAFALQLLGRWTEAVTAGANAAVLDEGTQPSARAHAADLAALSLSELRASRLDAALGDARWALRIDHANALAARVAHAAGRPPVPGGAAVAIQPVPPEGVSVAPNVDPRRRERRGGRS